MTVEGKLPVILLMASLMGRLGSRSSSDQWSSSITYLLYLLGVFGVNAFMFYYVKLEDYSYSTLRALSYLNDFYIWGSLLPFILLFGALHGSFFF
jgi:hypothetical protein